MSISHNNATFDGRYFTYILEGLELEWLAAKHGFQHFILVIAGSRTWLLYGNGAGFGILRHCWKLEWNNEDEDECESLSEINKSTYPTAPSPFAGIMDYHVMKVTPPNQWPFRAQGLMIEVYELLRRIYLVGARIRWKEVRWYSCWSTTQRFEAQLLGHVRFQNCQLQGRRD
jgi:hypothetical protein